MQRVPRSNIQMYLWKAKLYRRVYFSPRKPRGEKILCILKGKCKLFKRKEPLLEAAHCTWVNLGAITQQSFL